MPPIHTILRVRQMIPTTILRVFVALSILLAATVTHAVSAVGQRLAVYDRGQDSCGQFIEARRFNAQENVVYAVWVAGYITAYNNLTPDTLDLLNLQNAHDQNPMAGPMAWLERYCLDNPMSNVLTAVIKFTEMQYPSRKR